MEPLVQEFEKVSKRQKTTAADTISTIDQLIGHLRDAQSRLATSQAEESPLPALSSKVTTLATHSQTAHKEFASSLSKFGKSLEKRFKPIVQTTSPFEGKREVLDKVISKHLIREGRFASARAFEAEGGAKAEGSDAFAEMYAVLAALRGIPENEHEENAMMTDSPVTRKKPDLAPAIAWAKRNAVELYAASSHLEFELHRTRFIQMRDDGAPRNMLVDYVRTEMSGWVGRGFEKEVSQLLTSLLFPPSHRLFPNLSFAPLLASSTSLFVRTFCTLHRLPPRPPLLVSTLVGHAALPTLQKITALLQSTSGLSWSLTSELPTEIPLPPAFMFHSIFVCPVTREPYDGSETNPPTMLPCGHVVSKEALSRLVKGREPGGGRFKCPYCPREGTLVDCIRVHF